MFFNLSPLLVLTNVNSPLSFIFFVKQMSSDKIGIFANRSSTL
jgi:hypothetical protein